MEPGAAANAVLPAHPIAYLALFLFPLTETGADIARGADERMVWRNKSLLAFSFLKRNVSYCPSFHYHQPSPFSRAKELDGFVAEFRGKHAIFCDGGSTALNVSKSY